MTSKEKAVIEERITAAIHEAVSPEALLRAHEASLQAKLQELKRNRKALSSAKAKDSAIDKNQGNGKATTA